MSLEEVLSLIGGDNSKEFVNFDNDKRLVMRPTFHSVETHQHRVSVSVTGKRLDFERISLGVYKYVGCASSATPDEVDAAKAWFDDAVNVTLVENVYSQKLGIGVSF